MATGVLPAEFKTGNISPILKPGKRDNSAPNSYRGISLTCVLAKVLEKIVHQQLEAHFHKIGAYQGSSQRSQGVAGRYPLTVDVPVPLRLSLQKRRYAFDMSSFCWSFLLSVSRSQAGVKYMKHVVRNEGDACFSFSTSVVSFQVRVYPATALCCGACRVNDKPKFKEEKRSLKLHTLVERRGKHSTTDQDMYICIKIDLAQDSEG